jgi:hypothetical protein
MGKDFKFSKREPDAPTPPGAPGRMVRDAKGNAVWNWVKDTGRHAIDSTSRLLKRLESADLKLEESKEQEMRILTDQKKDPGGGYDPYNQDTRKKDPLKRK